MEGTSRSRDPAPKCPRQDSNLRSRFRKPMLYPLSYGSNVQSSLSIETIGLTAHPHAPARVDPQCFPTIKTRRPRSLNEDRRDEQRRSPSTGSRCLTCPTKSGNAMISAKGRSSLWLAICSLHSKGGPYDTLNARGVLARYDRRRGYQVRHRTSRHSLYCRTNSQRLRTTDMRRPSRD